MMMAHQCILQNNHKHYSPRTTAPLQWHHCSGTASRCAALHVAGTFAAHAMQMAFAIGRTTPHHTTQAGWLRLTQHLRSYTRNKPSAQQH
jgi:hypothetical protein